jgi:hypothetical protein
MRWLPGTAEELSGQCYWTPQRRAHTGRISRTYSFLPDDNADMRDYVKSGILSRHWHVEAVSDGIAALVRQRAVAYLILCSRM